MFFVIVAQPAISTLRRWSSSSDLYTRQDSGPPIDDLLAGLTQAVLKHQWLANETSEQRRLKLLPLGKAMLWDELMTDNNYMHAMGLLP